MEGQQEIYNDHGDRLVDSFNDKICVIRVGKRCAWYESAIKERLAGWILASIQQNIKNVFVGVVSNHMLFGYYEFIKDIIESGYTEDVMVEKCSRNSNGCVLRLSSGTTVSFYSVRRNECRGISFDWCFMILYELSLNSTIEKGWNIIEPILRLTNSHAMIYILRPLIDLEMILGVTDEDKNEHDLIMLNLDDELNIDI